jgi:RNA polymerase sigma-70 factor (ECF subfamily)
MKNSWTGGETSDRQAVGVAENLAVAVHRGEPGALERLIERFERPLFTYAHGILQNVFDAQEVVQDAMMRAHRALTRQYDEARCAALALRPWLFRTVRNLCLNKRRSKRSSLEQPLETFDDGRLGPFVAAGIGTGIRLEGPDLEQKEELEQLRQAMSLLPVDARELIVLRFMEEMSYGEIARTIGASEAALRGKVFRSLKLLRDALEKGPAQKGTVQRGVAYAM